MPQLGEAQRQAMSYAIEEDVPEALGFIESSVEHMDEFLSAVLQLSRLGRRQLVFEEVDVEAIVQTVLGSLAHQLKWDRWPTNSKSIR